MINILGYLPGKSDKWIILGSHFDTMPGIPNFKGANDFWIEYWRINRNGSSTQ